jgi:uncharacterized protein (TIRG00374 family)
MNLRRALPWLLLAAVIAFVGWKLRTSHFDWAGFARSWQTADLKLIALATAVIYSNYVLRAMRWAVFLRPAFKQSGARPIHWWSLNGSQFIGFAGLAIFGRIGELIRPLLVSRRTGLSFSSQIAVVTVERVFDLGAFAILFSLNLLFSPSLQTLPYHERFHTVGFVIAGLTLFIGAFVAGVRLAGGAVAALTASLVGLVSKPAGAAAKEKILAFRDGLNVIDNLADFAWAAGLSLLLWAAIALSYVIVMRAFPPPVHDLTISHILVMMGFSVVGGIVQLPGVGGGTQVGTISALTLLFGIPQELAVSAGLILWLVTNMSVIPVGLIYAKIEGISLGQLKAVEGQLTTVDDSSRQ